MEYLLNGSPVEMEINEDKLRINNQIYIGKVTAVEDEEKITCRVEQAFAAWEVVLTKVKAERTETKDIRVEDAGDDDAWAMPISIGE